MSPLNFERDARPCLCKCGCPSRGIVTRRERLQSLNRCVDCRRFPTPTCGRIQVHDKPPVANVRPWGDRHRVNKADHEAARKARSEALDQTIEAQLNRLRAKRRGPKFQVGSAGGRSPLAIPPTALDKP